MPYGAILIRCCGTPCACNGSDRRGLCLGAKPKTAEVAEKPAHRSRMGMICVDTRQLTVRGLHLARQLTLRFYY